MLPFTTDNSDEPPIGGPWRYEEGGCSKFRVPGLGLSNKVRSP
jgi:hypothetical protein